MGKRKYEILKDDSKIVLSDVLCAGITVYRIRALRDIKSHSCNIKAGELGGYVESEINLSHEGSSWIDSSAVVCGDAVVQDSSNIKDDSIIIGIGEVVKSDLGIKEDVPTLSIKGFTIVSRSRVETAGELTNCMIHSSIIQTYERLEFDKDDDIEYSSCIIRNNTSITSSELYGKISIIYDEPYDISSRTTIHYSRIESLGHIILRGKIEIIESSIIHDNLSLFSNSDSNGSYYNNCIHIKESLITKITSTVFYSRKNIDGGIYNVIDYTGSVDQDDKYSDISILSQINDVHITQCKLHSVKLRVVSNDYGDVRLTDMCLNKSSGDIIINSMNDVFQLTCKIGIVDYNISLLPVRLTPEIYSKTKYVFFVNMDGDYIGRFDSLSNLTTRLKTLLDNKSDVEKIIEMILDKKVRNITL